MLEVILTKEEQKVINRLENLSKKWPKNLMLFSWSGSLVIIKDRCIVGRITNIFNDGGDPDSIDIDPELGFDCNPEIIYEN